MNAPIRSIISYGSGGLAVDIECHLANSLPGIVIVGAASKTVDEAKERIRGAFYNAGLQMPRKRISINLAPADIPKGSSSLDLPIAAAIMAAAGMLPEAPTRKQAFIGELGLDGTIRPVRGIIGKLLAGRALGIDQFFIPKDNLRQAQIVPRLELVPVESLRQLYEMIASIIRLVSFSTGEGILPAGAASPNEANHRLDEIVGHRQAKRALEIAAAGGHNVLLNGPPGTGKSMLAQALTSLLPPLSHEEILEVTHLHSLTGLEYGKLVTERPVRAPHHSASHTAVVGGGASVRPGEVSLAHRGVLFFDELPEFARATIEALRQPLEDRAIAITRARQSARFPANFIFAATANPCPCGFYGTEGGRCSCTARAVQQYRQKLSGPLLDRIDLHVDVEHITYDRLLEAPAGGKPAGEGATARRRVLAARSIQAKRFKDRNFLNSDMTNRQLREQAGLSADAKRLLDLSANRLQLSARGYMRSVRVARTIADLARAPTIGPQHITEALQYRSC